MNENSAPTTAMGENLERLAFSTADASGVELSYGTDVLTVRYRDWREKPIQQRFASVMWFSWKVDDLTRNANQRDDEAYVVRGSAQLRRSLDAAHSPLDWANMEHYRLCFNALGILDVIAGGLDLGPGTTPEPDSSA